MAFLRSHEIDEPAIDVHAPQPWGHHRTELFVAGTVLFWSIALRRYLATARHRADEHDDDLIRMKNK